MQLYTSPRVSHSAPAASFSLQMAIGVLALQGSFHEHISALRKIGVEAVEVRKPEQLVGLSGLIIPGGESTTMSKLAQNYNLFPALREFTSSGKPVWGTCAGLIFLADKAVGVKAGGQELLGGLDCTVHRNFFGSQVNSFETELPVPDLVAEEGGPSTFRAVFIRAPAIVETGPSVKILATYILPSGSSETDSDSPTDKVKEPTGEKLVVAVKQGHLLGTAFHPELTADTRWHSFFMKMVRQAEAPDGAQKSGITDSIYLLPPHVKDLPVFGESDHLRIDLQ